MSGSTPVLGLTLPGGGSQNKYGPPDVVDIDKLNEDLLKLDSAVGVPQVANNAALPSKPFLWQTVHVLDSDAIVSWNGSNWINFLPARLGASALASQFYSQKQLNEGSLDGRYFTEDELLNGGKLDGRYYTRTASDQRYALKSAGGGPRIAYGTSYASGFNLDSDTGRYKIGVSVVINPPLAGATNVQLFGMGVSQDAGGVVVNQDPDTLAGPGGGKLIVTRRNNFGTTINWMAVGT